MYNSRCSKIVALFSLRKTAILLVQSIAMDFLYILDYLLVYLLLTVVPFHPKKQKIKIRFGFYFYRSQSICLSNDQLDDY